MNNQDEMLIRIDERVEAMAKTMAELDKVVRRGNGRPSLISRVENLEAGTTVKVALVTSLGALGTAIVSHLAT